MKKTIISAVLAILLIACGKKEASGLNEEKNSGTQTASQQNSNTQNTTLQNKDIKSVPGVSFKKGELEVSWDVTFIGTGEYDTPINEVNIIVNGKKHFILKEYFNFYPTPQSDYKINDIPPEALIALRGWWAGVGVDIWALQKNSSIEVYTREIGETTNESGDPGDFTGKPELVKSIKIE